MTQEFEFVGRAMPWRDVLFSLTTNPSECFKATNQGRIEKGMDAALVSLDADPATDVRNFSKVGYAIRAGKVIYCRANKAFLNIENGIGRIVLSKDYLLSRKGFYFSAAVNGRKESLRIEFWRFLDACHDVMVELPYSA
jgi:hypothetical protein